MIFLSGMSKRSFAEVLATLAPADHVDEIALYDSGKEISRIPNITGKAGSVRVLSNSLGFEDGLLTQEDISVILERFAEHTEYEIAHPEEGRHPGGTNSCLNASRELRPDQNQRPRNR